ncbi:hypothetical protein Tco_0598037 [Tanacetum coccineum]
MEPEDSLNMGGEYLSTIPEKESDEVIKSSVEDLVPIPSESEDTSDNDSECDLPFCDNPVTFSNPLFDFNNDFTSSDDESLPEEDVPEENFKIYSNPLFEFDKEYISSDINPLYNEVLEDIESKDSYDDEPALLVTHLSELNEDECFDPGGDEIKACLTSDSIPPGIDGADFDPEGDILLLEKLLNDDPSSPLPLKELHFEGLKVIKSYIPPDFEDDYYDSEGVPKCGGVLLPALSLKEKRIEITNDGWRLRIEHVRSLALISFAGETANDGNPIDKEERRCSSTMKLRLEERGLGPGRAFRDWVGWIIELGAKDERSGPGFESNRPSLSSQGEARNSSKCSFFNISRSWISCSSDPEWILVEGQSKALQAFESKHGHLQLRGSSRSSMEEPSEEEGEGFIPPAAHVSDPKGIANERRICVHYPWSGVTILNLLFSISPFFAFGYYRLATLGPTLDLFENNTSKVAFIQSKLLCPSTNDSLWKERNAGNKSFLSTGS